MQKTTMRINGQSLPVYSLNTVVVGSGAAGLSAAERLYEYGERDIALVTEHINAGTSRNTGSDKQTYYKLTLAGADPDSVREMASTLYSGKCVDGEHALCEAALSAECFLRLAEMGVSFPRNKYGEFIGYKTDHDPRRRATSVGPYTSRMMTEALERAVNKKGITIFSRHLVVKILTCGEKAVGLLCLNLEAHPGQELFSVFNCKNIIYATGGPAGMYADSVYPLGHYGASGIAFEAGVMGKNLTEWQYGMASLKPRWNVSGTYMQVLPKFISTNAEGKDEKEFLSEFFADFGEMLSLTFLKGYQWPFDVRKAAGGSSLIDLLVHIERSKGRRVFLDYRTNPGGGELGFSLLSPEATAYLEQAGACFGTPIERLAHMNSPAVEFYRDKGVDLATEPLEISLCAQHNNGGLAINEWWHTNLEGFFAVGEASASHGVYRPGGSALNAGQVGAARAARYIAAKRSGEPCDLNKFEQAVSLKIEEALVFAQKALVCDGEPVDSLWQQAAQRMSLYGAAIRNEDGMKKAATQTKEALEKLPELIQTDEAHMHKAFRLRDMLISQYVYLSAMLNYTENGANSRGSALYTNAGGEKPHPELSEIFACILETDTAPQIQEVSYQNGECSFNWRDARPIPEDDDFFENVWRTWRESGNID